MQKKAKITAFVIYKFCVIWRLMSLNIFQSSKLEKNCDDKKPLFLILRLKKYK